MHSHSASTQNVLAVLVLFVTAFLPLAFATAMTGAIFTTDGVCAGTNVNLFDAKSDVYLDGGPHHVGSAGLPDGNYYVQVTAPGGGQLGHTLTNSVVVSGGSFALCYQLSNILVKTSDATPGYDTTTNGGGVYKVWVSQTSTFDNSTNKTDNFKVKETDDGGNDPGPTPDTGSISGVKWEDMNADGIKDAGEPLLTGWVIDLYDSNNVLLNSTVTDGTGYSFNGLADGTYKVCEEQEADWYSSFPGSTDPNCHPAVVVAGGIDTPNVDFGNYQLASLTVIKRVVNDNGGTAAANAFTMNVTGSNPSQTSFAGSEAGVVVTVKPGAYTAGETPVAGYAQTLPDADCAGVATSGAVIECTITNDDIAPSLTLNKVVVNDNTGTQLESAWTLTANGGLAGILSGLGAAGATDVVSSPTFQAGTYALSESGPAGYQTAGWVCTGVTNTGSSLTIGIGQSAVCTIINDDIPPTRTQGFWSTHTAFSSNNWSLVPAGEKFFCATNGTRTVDAVQTVGANKLMGGFLSDIAKKTNGNRTAIEKTRMVLLQQLLAALLNKYVLGNTTADAAIVAGKTAYCGTSAAAMTTSTAALDAFNNSGDVAPLSPSMIPGSATPALSQSQANKGFWNVTI